MKYRFKCVHCGSHQVENRTDGVWKCRSCLGVAPSIHDKKTNETTRRTMSNNNYQKGAKAENELIHDLETHGYVASRVAGSGSIDAARPDVQALKAGKPPLVAEVKNWNDGTGGLKKPEVRDLYEYADTGGAVPLLVVRQDARKHDKWAVYSLDDLQEADKSYRVNQSVQRRARHLGAIA